MEIKYKTSKKAQNIRIKISFNGKIEAIYPTRIPRKFAEKFVTEKKDWIIKQLNKISQKKINPVLNTDSREHFLIHKQQAFDFVTERVKFWNEKYDFSYDKIVVKKLKSNWGTCSSKKVLTFNYKILFLAPNIADYIVVHELCHLKEMNHSINFWKLVAQELPNAKKLHKNIGALA
jgi:predicted metal-dependent hydrolase